MSLLLGLGLLQSRELALREDEPLLGPLRLKRLQALFHGLKVVALPDPSHTGRRDRMAALADLVGNADLAKGRLLQRQIQDDALDLGRGAIGQQRLAAGPLPHQLKSTRLKIPPPPK